VATSTGSLEFYNFDSATARLGKRSSKQVTEASTLVLDLLWHPSRADIIVVTLSDGAVALCRSSVNDKSDADLGVLRVRQLRPNWQPTPSNHGLWLSLQTLNYSSRGVTTLFCKL
jgi:hypothetical protein